MALRHIGTDPDSGFNGSPTVWVDEDDGSLVLQGWRITDEATLAQITAKGRSPATRPCCGSRPAWRHSCARPSGDDRDDAVLSAPVDGTLGGSPGDARFLRARRPGLAEVAVGEPVRPGDGLADVVR